MRSCLFLFTLVLFFTGLSQVEGKSKYQFVNFLKFLKLMKANGWDKKVFDSNNRKIAKNLLLPKLFKEDYGSELELEKKKEKTLTHCQEGKNKGCHLEGMEGQITNFFLTFFGIYDEALSYILHTLILLVTKEK